MYKTTFSLNHDEIPAKINSNTGEVSEIKYKFNNIPEDKTVFNKSGLFAKCYEAAMDYLLDNLTDVEIRIVMRMIQMSRMNSNSLEPLNNSTKQSEIASTFNIHRNHVTRIFNNLLKHGVYAEFKFGAKGKIKHYWVLNPYIAFKGKTISKALVDLFRETDIALLCTK